MILRRMRGVAFGPQWSTTTEPFRPLRAALIIERSLAWRLVSLAVVSQRSSVGKPARASDAVNALSEPLSHLTASVLG